MKSRIVNRILSTMVTSTMIVSQVAPMNVLAAEEDTELSCDVMEDEEALEAINDSEDDEYEEIIEIDETEVETESLEETENEERYFGADYEYELNDKNQATITSYHGDASVLVIPSTMDGYDVIAIGESVFKEHSELTSVTIPDTVKEIHYEAFASCSNLSEVILSKSLVALDGDAFSDCDKITEIFIPKSLESGSIAYGDGPFCECDGLKTVVFEEGTTKIANALFRKCTGLEEITIPDTVTSIGHESFAYCDNLTTVNFGKNIAEIGDRAFKECTKITSITLPNSVTSIETQAFASCSELSEVTLSKGLTQIDGSVFYDCDKITEIFIPKSLESGSIAYGDGPFCECDGLKTVTFEEGTTKIANALFRKCTGLEEITIPDTVTAIEYNSFEGCESLTTVHLGENVAEIGNCAFRDCKNLESISMPNTVTSIGENAFSSCYELSEVTLSKNIVEIGADAFYDCDKITEIFIPKSLERGYIFITDGPFRDCDGLKTVVFEQGTTKIADHLFRNCTGLEEVVIPNTVTVIGVGAFYSCANLATVTFGEKVEEIQNGAFYDCDTLVEIEIPDTVKKLGRYIFADCAMLEKVGLPSDVDIIPEDMFLDCVALKEMDIPESVTAIEASAFEGCLALEKIVIPHNVEEIRDDAFEKCESLETVVIESENDVIIRSAVFRDCKALKNVTMPDTVKEISFSCFEGCISLETITLSRSLTCIPEKCFYGCDLLKEITLPYYVQEIGDKAFANDYSLTDVYIPRNTETFGKDIFSYKEVVTIHGVSGTPAETYATDNELKFVAASVTATSVKFTEESYTIYTNEKFRLPFVITPDNATDEVNWTVTKNSEKISVIAGVVEGLEATEKDSPAVIKLVVGDQIASCKIIVLQSVTSIGLNETSLTMDAGSSFQLTADVYPYDATEKAIEWSCSDESVATVDQDGLVTALTKGSCTITVTAKDGGISESCQITVPNTATYVTKAEDFQSEHPYGKNCSDIWVYEKKGAGSISVTFTADTALEADTDADYILIKDENGEVVGQYSETELAGKTIKVDGSKFWLQLVSDAIDSKDYGFSVSKIEVGEASEDPEKVEVTGVSLDETELNLTINDTSTLTATIEPSDATNQNVSWSSDNKNVATVDEDGNVTAVGAGTATITVTTEDGEYTAECVVTVADTVVQVTGVSLGRTSLDLSVGKSATLEATISPKDATNTNVSWSSDNESVATVDENGKVTAVAAGEATITVKTEDGEYTSDCKVTVTEEAESFVIVVDPEDLKLSEGETAALSVTTEPESVTEQKFTYKSSDEDVATVDQDGKVTAVAEGTAIITVATEDGTVTSDCKVTVEAKAATVTGVSLNATKLEMVAGKTAELTATVEPEDAPDKTVTWSSDKPAVATVDENGKVTAVAAGTTKITATTADGEKTATCVVTVTKKTEISQNTFSLDQASEGVPVINNSDYTLKVDLNAKGGITSASIVGSNGKVAEEVDSYLANVVTEYEEDGKTPKTFYTLVFSDGKWDTTYDSGQKGAYQYMGVEYFVAGGVVNQNANGLIYTGAAGWRFLAAGHVVTNNEGLVMYNGEWFWIDAQGKCDDTYAAIVKWNGANFLVHGGRLRTDYTGFTYDPKNTSVWYHITAGQVWGEGEITDISIEGGEITRNVVGGKVQ